MRTVKLSEAKQNLSELVDRASKGERIGITRRGRLVAMIVSPRSAMTVAEAFADLDKIRKHAKPLNGVTIKELIEEGRR